MMRLETDIFKEMTREAPETNKNNDDSNVRTRIDFFFHLHCIYCFFLRISWVNKYNLLRTFVKEVRSIGSLSLLMNTMRTSSRKVHAYKMSTPASKIDFDKVLLDHNRMLEDDLAVTQMKAELQWFCTLSDKNQEVTLIALLRTGGGAIIDQIFLDCCREYEKRLKINATLEKERILKESKEKIFIKDNLDEIKLDDDLINHPINIQCEKLKAEYDTMISAYRKKIFGKEQKPKKKSKSKKAKKSKKPKKLSKKSKKSRKGSKKQEETTIDRIEALPLQLALRIFGYLTPSELQKVRKVNGQWNWMVQQSLSLRKTRTFLDNAISQIRKSITFDAGEVNVRKYALDVEDDHRVSFTERKMAQLQHRGAILKKLRSDEGYPLEDYSVVVDSVQKLASEMNKSSYITANFHPRLKVPIEDAELTRYPKMMYKDVNLIAQHQESPRRFSQSVLTVSEQSESLPSKRTMAGVSLDKVISEKTGSVSNSVGKTWFCLFNANPLVINMQ